MGVILDKFQFILFGIGVNPTHVGVILMYDMENDDKEAVNPTHVGVILWKVEKLSGGAPVNPTHVGVIL